MDPDFASLRRAPSVCTALVGDVALGGSGDPPALYSRLLRSRSATAPFFIIGVSVNASTLFIFLALFTFE